MGASTIPVMPAPDELVGQDMLLPYEPVYVAGVPTYALEPPSVEVPRSGGFAAPIALVPLDAYAPPQQPNASVRVLGTTGTLPTQPNGASPCGCNGAMLSIPWWGWALMAVGAVAMFRRIT